MRSIAIDIETMWDNSKDIYVPEKQPKDKKDPKEKLAYNSLFNQILCIGYKQHDEKGCFSQDSFDFNEGLMLKAFWKYICEFNPDKIITFNGLVFDIPTLYMRSWLHNVYPSIWIDQRRYYVTNHVDVRAILTNWDNYAIGSMDMFYQIKFGKSCKTIMDGSKVAEYWMHGQYETVCNYCIDDCESLWDLYMSMEGYFNNV